MATNCICDFKASPSLEIFLPINGLFSNTLISANSKRPFAKELVLIKLEKLKDRTISMAAVCSGFICKLKPKSSFNILKPLTYSGLRIRAIVFPTPIFLAIKQLMILISSLDVAAMIKSAWSTCASFNTS